MFDTWGFDRRLWGADWIRAYAVVNFIIDHLGILQPRTPPAPPQPWADLPKVLDLAKRSSRSSKVIV